MGRWEVAFTFLLSSLLPALLMYQLHTAPHQTECPMFLCPLIIHLTLNEGLHYSDPVTSLPLVTLPLVCSLSALPSYPFLFAVHFSQVARGILRKLIWILSPTCLKSFHGCLFLYE